MRSGVDGSVLWLEISAPSAASARATAEDLLPCLAAAERTLGLTAAADPGER